MNNPRKLSYHQKKLWCPACGLICTQQKIPWPKVFACPPHLRTLFYLWSWKQPLLTATKILHTTDIPALWLTGSQLRCRQLFHGQCQRGEDLRSVTTHHRKHWEKTTEMYWIERARFGPPSLLLQFWTSPFYHFGLWKFWCHLRKKNNLYTHI